jgi:hypothetical protein
LGSRDDDVLQRKSCQVLFFLFYEVGGLEFHEFSSSGSADMVAVRRRDGYRARALEKATHTHTHTHTQTCPETKEESMIAQ